MAVAPLVLAACALAAPQEPSPNGRAEGRAAQVGRVEPDAAPRLDGWLDDPCWETAPSLGQLVTAEPREGLVPPHDTVIRVLHDGETLWFAIWCADSEPESIRATQRARDADLEPDDRIEMLIDPFRQRTQTYFFQIGAAGSIGDALVSATSFQKSWDAIWDGRARVTADGWQAELAIPFRSIAFPEGGSTWGFNIRRIRRVTNADYRFANATQSVPFFRLGSLGELVGFADIEARVAIDAVPYAKASTRRERLADLDWDGDLEGGGEVYWRVTPSMTAVLTVNTDFAETENDSRQINLTRFPLFFPEKRDFFLQDAERFLFGPGRNDFLPFFSRRIGIGPDGEIPIDVGVKVSGQAGRWGIGALAVSTGEGGGNDFRRELGVAKVDYSIADETRVGLIGTFGRPTERGSNGVVGVDFYHREPVFVGDLDLQLWAYLTASETSDDGGDGAAGGVRALAQGREWVVEADTRFIDRDYNPELGFVRRPGVKNGDLDVSWLPRSDVPGVRHWRFGVNSGAIVDQGNELQELELRVTPFGVRWHSGDDLRTFVKRTFEYIDAPFEIFDGVTVPAGDYYQNAAGLTLATSEGRPLSAVVSGSFGELYGGDFFEWSASAGWRASGLLIVGGRAVQTHAELPGGSFTSRIYEGTLDLHLSPRLSVYNLVQFDNGSNNLGVQSRTRWIVKPGSDLFVVVTAGWVREDDGSLLPDAQEIAVKLAWTFRF